MGKKPAQGTYGAILSLSEAEVRERFPFGANKVGDEEWEPAQGSSADKTLRDLLRERKRVHREMDPIRLLARGGPRYDPKKEDEEGDLRDHGYTSDAHLALADAGEAVSEAEQKKISADGEARFNSTHVSELFDQQGRVLAARLAKMQREAAKYGIDYGPRLESLLRDWRTELTEVKKAA